MRLAGTANFTGDNSSAGKILAYSEAVAPQTPINGVGPADLTGLSVTFTAGARPVVIEACVIIQTLNATAGSHSVFLTDASNNLKAIGKANLGAVTNSLLTVMFARIFTGGTALTPGTSYTFKLRLAGATAGASLASQADPTFPAYIRAING